MLNGSLPATRPAGALLLLQGKGLVAMRRESRARRSAPTRWLRVALSGEAVQMLGR